MVKKGKDKNNLFKYYQINLHILASLKILFKYRLNDFRKHLLFYLFIYIMNNFIYVNILEITSIYNINNKNYQWDSITIGYFRLIYELSLIIVLLISWNLLNFLKSIQLSIIILIGLGIRIIQLLPLLITEPYQQPFVILCIIGGLTVLNEPTILTEIIHFIDFKDYGTILSILFSVNCLFELFIELIIKKLLSIYIYKQQNIIWGPIILVSIVLFLIFAIWIQCTKIHNNRNNNNPQYYLNHPPIYRSKRLKLLNKTSIKH